MTPGFHDLRRIKCGWSNPTFFLIARPAVAEEEGAIVLSGGGAGGALQLDMRPFLQVGAPCPLRCVCVYILLQPFFLTDESYNYQSRVFGSGFIYQPRGSRMDGLHVHG